MRRISIIPFSLREDAVSILFVTSQTRGRWVLPKGKRKPRETHIETCLREGFEEAGVLGQVLEEFPMTVPITRQTSLGIRTNRVTYYPLLVAEQFNDWPEQTKRRRRWALIKDAPRVANHSDLRHLLQKFNHMKDSIIAAVGGNGTGKPLVQILAK